MYRLVAALAVPLVTLLAAVLWAPHSARTDSLQTITRPDGQATLRAELPGVGGRRVEARAPERTAQHANPDRSGARTPAQAPQAGPAPGSLEVTIDTMTPSVLPRRGPLVLSGTVANRTDEPWIGLNIHPFLSYFPMQTAEELEVSAESDAEIYLGPRIVTPGAFDNSIDELAPGANARWEVRIPQADLRAQADGSDGVYWVGVHALGADSTGRDAVADGRARTFIPRVSPGVRQVPTSIVLPIRHAVRHQADGSLADPEEWAAEFGPGGRLNNILDLAERAGNASITFVIDPAVLDAARRIAAGNPPRDLRPTVTEEDAEQPAEEETEGTDDEPEEPSAAQAAAEDWLTRLTARTSGNRVLALPYGDLDVSGALRSHAALFASAQALSETTFKAAGITATPAVVPPSGVVNPALLGQLTAGTVLLVSDDALPSGGAGPAPAAVTTSGRRVEVYDAAASTGGPLPGSRLGAVALRQRILAEAVVRSLSPGSDPALVVSLPHDFDPGPANVEFFRGLERPFLGLVPAAAGTGDAPEVEELAYPQGQARRELGSPVFAATQSLIDVGASLDSVLSENDAVAGVIAGEAMTGASYLVRGDREAAIRGSQASASWVRGQLNRISIDAPSFVILSAESGPFAVTVRNGLDQPVTVQIQAHTRDDLVIRAPARIELAPESRQTVNLTAQANSIGVHPVRIVATDENGQAVGQDAQINIRSNNTGRIIWVVMGVGVGILFLAVLVRLVRRFRTSPGR